MIFSRKPVKNYFIDSENVNDVWVANIVNDLGKTDHIYIFYSENSTHMKSDSVRRLMELGSDRVTWIRCYIGTNALDFQLVTVLGAVTSDSRAEDECIIVSNDNGFDAVVQFWQDQGHEVSRLKMDTSAGRSKRQNRPYRKPAKKIQSQKPDLKPVQQPTQKPSAPAAPSKQKPAGSAETPKQQTPKAAPKAQKPVEKPTVKKAPEPQKPVPAAKKEQEPPKKTEAAKKPQKKQQESKGIEPSKRSQTVLKSVCRSIPSKDAGQLHDALNALLGDQEGMVTYNYIKNTPKAQQELSGILLPEAERRAANYVQLICAIAGIEESASKEISAIYTKERSGGLQAINLAMVKTFGQEQAQKYYPDLKRHFRILEKISNK